MIFDYLKTIRSIPLDFSKYLRSSNREIIISIGKSGYFMYRSFITEYPFAADFPRLIIVPSETPVNAELSDDILFSSHPYITEHSFHACEKLFDFINKNNPEKVTVLLSGGSSALIEKSSDPEKTIKTNGFLLKSGLNILEINRIRSENSIIKNGKLAEFFSFIKWQVFVMSDVPFENGEKIVGSMPFFRDDLKNTTLFKCADSNTLHDHFLPFLKDATSLRNFCTTVNDMRNIVIDFINNSTGDLIITGEPTLKIDHSSFGKGGRMSHLALQLLPYINKNMKLYTLSSDGIDGNSGFAGAVIENISGKSFNISEIQTALEKFDSATFLNKYNMTLESGYTGINLNDFVILLRT